MTNAEARFNKSLHPRKPEGSLGRTAQDGHLDSHTAPELCEAIINITIKVYIKLKILPIETIPRAYTHTGTYTHQHTDYTTLNLHTTCSK